MYAHLYLCARAQGFAIDGALFILILYTLYLYFAQGFAIDGALASVIKAYLVVQQVD